MTACTQHRKPVSWGWRRPRTGVQRSDTLVAGGCPVPYPAVRGGGISERVTPATRFVEPAWPVSVL